MSHWYNNPKSKYHNEVVVVEGITFDSKGEYRRWCFLKLMEQAGEIHNLRYHVKYELIPAITEDVVVHLKTKDKIVTKTVQSARYYEADFVYIKAQTGASTRCMPFEQEQLSDVCVCCGKPAKKMVYFGRAY